MKLSNSNRPKQSFPFTAVVGQEALKTALLLSTIDPRIGGVLISGARGCAKSTLARSLIDFLPEQSQLITLPLGASEEQLIGSLDLQAALSEQQVNFNPGLLYKAHQGILYIDEVNLLPDHLVDVLLDAAASGSNIIERDGISHQHDAEFVLIGTMNPDEGIIRPQLLDRFGLFVDINTPLNAEERVNVVDRRLAFEQDPALFYSQYAEHQHTLQQQVTTAKQALPQVTSSQDIKLSIAQQCIAANVEGLRADITWLRAATAYAALQKNTQVTEQDVNAVRALVLAHREQPQPNDNQPPPPSTQPKPHIETAQAQGDWGEMPTEHITSAPLRKLPIENNAFVAPQTSTPSRNAGQQTSQCSGPQPGEKTNVHWFKTLSSPSRQNQPLTLKYKGQKKHRSMLHLILLDTSASTIAHNALAKAKGLVAGISQQAYLAREHLAVFAFGNQRCEWLLPPQRAVKDCRSQLNIVPAGGGTPLRIALNKAQQWIKRYKQQTPGTPLHVYLLTDGRSTETVSDLLWQEQTTVIDIESRPVPLGKCKQLAQQLGAQYISIQQIPELTS